GRQPVGGEPAGARAPADRPGRAGGGAAVARANLLTPCGGTNLAPNRGTRIGRGARGEPAADVAGPRPGLGRLAARAGPVGDAGQGAVARRQPDARGPDSRSAPPLAA